MILFGWVINSSQRHTFPEKRGETFFKEINYIYKTGEFRDNSSSMPCIFSKKYNTNTYQCEIHPVLGHKVSFRYPHFSPRRSILFK